MHGYGDFTETDEDYCNLFEDECANGRLDNGGTNRMALTADDDLQRNWFIRQLSESGMHTLVDGIGNIYGRYEWIEGAPFVLAGSHLDSQENGGLYDGAYGVVCALAAARHIARLNDRGCWTPKKNLAVVSWTNEEGARFEPSIMGSRVFTKALDIETVLESKDEHGVRLGDELVRLGWNGPDEWIEPVDAYAEIHVEQGSCLERTGTNIGVVVGNWAAVKIDVAVEGEQSHTGATPMPERRDALYAAALVIVETRKVADSYPDDQVHTSVTKLRTFPHSPNIVTSKANFHIEVRSASYATAIEASEKLIASFERLASVSGTAIRTMNMETRENMSYWRPGWDLSEHVADVLGLSHSRIKTISGHDSVAMNAKYPTVMLFAPSAGGYAHSPKEYTDPEAQIKGMHELTGVLMQLLQ